MHELDTFFFPKTVAVIGASSEKESIGRTIFENFLSGHLKNRVYPVNPNHAKVLGKKSFKSVKDIPGSVDLSVIVVPAKFVPTVAHECVEKGVKSVIIISAGFSEIGEKKITEELAQVMKKSKHTRWLGPNCFGVLENYSGLNTTFSASAKTNYPKKGHVSFISQSGALGVAILDWMSTQPFGLSKFVSYGNAMDIDEADLLKYLDYDKRTKVITVYLEGVKEGRKFMKIAKRTSPKTPIILLKGGIYEETHKATASHTGSLAGSSDVYNALFKQTGIIQAHDLQELFMFAKTISLEPLPSGNRVQIITNGGGMGVVTADQVLSSGLELAKISPNVKKMLEKKFPKTVTVANPLDLVGDADDKRYATAIEAALSDKNVDMLLVIVLFNTPAVDKKVVKEIVKAKKKSKKPLAVVTIGSGYTKAMVEELEKNGVVVFSYPGIAALSLKALSDYAARHKNKGKRN
ncbi:MAG: CoA-binding protein [archaeon]|nr:CoA-binding protein [archaeon]